MGYFEIYCVICGIHTGTYYNLENSLEKLQDILDKGKYNPISKKTLKQQKKEKDIDSNMIKTYKKFIKDVNKVKNKFNWCNKTCLIIDNDKKINNTSSIDDGGSVELNGKVYETQKFLWYKTNKSLICHRSCYKLLCDKLNYKLKVSDVEKKINDYSLLKSYGKIVDKYTGLQDFPWMDMILNTTNHHFEILLDDKKKIKITNNIDFLIDPLKNKRNQDRILKIWKPIATKNNKKNSEKKKKKDRPSPSESATLFKIGQKKKGNDGNMYIIAVNKNMVKRWKKIN